MEIPLQHPCQSFSLPPHPGDPKHPGPRRLYMPAIPSVSPYFKNLNYILEENLLAHNSTGGSVFGGYPFLQQRNEAFDIKESMSGHCGFVKGRKPGQGTGFDIDEADLLEMQKCYGGHSLGYFWKL